MPTPRDPFSMEDPTPDTKDPVLVALRRRARVPDTCLLPSMLLVAIMMTEPDPCAGCNHDRAQCKGRPNNEEGRRYR